MTKHAKMSQYIVDRLIEGTECKESKADTSKASRDLNAFTLKQDNLPDAYVFVYPNEVRVEFDYHDSDLFPEEIIVLKTNDPRLFEKGRDFLKKKTEELKKIAESGENVKEVTNFRA